MDKKLEAAFEMANYMTTLASQKLILKEEYEQNLLYYYNGGVFKITPDFVAFVKLLDEYNKDKHPVLVDANGIPIDVNDLSEFLYSIMSVYYKAVNEYYTKYEQLRKSRTIESITSL